MLPGFAETLVELGGILPTVALTNATLFTDRLLERARAARRARRRAPGLARLGRAGAERQFRGPENFAKVAGGDPARCSRAGMQGAHRDDRRGPDAATSSSACARSTARWASPTTITSSARVVRRGRAATRGDGRRAGPDRHPARADDHGGRRVPAPVRADSPQRVDRSRPARARARSRRSGGSRSASCAIVAEQPVGDGRRRETSGEREAGPAVAGHRASRIPLVAHGGGRRARAAHRRARARRPLASGTIRAQVGRPAARLRALPAGGVALLAGLGVGRAGVVARARASRSRCGPPRSIPARRRR